MVVEMKTKQDCEYCTLPIDTDRIEIAYIGNKLVFFHPMRCRMSPDGTNCLSEYKSSTEEIIDALNTDMKDLERTSETEFIRLLKEQQEK